MKDYLQA